MKAIMLKAFQGWNVEGLKIALQVLIVLLAYPLVQRMVLSFDGTSGYVDPSILVLIVLSMVCFVGVLVLCGWLFGRFLMVMELPDVGSMVSQFNDLNGCQKLGFYFASFSVLIISAVLCLSAIL